MKNSAIKTLAPLLILPLGSCFLFEQEPTDPLGHLVVDAVLVYDTCGPGTISQGAVMTYEVDLSRSGDTLRWSGPGGAQQGTMTSDTDFCIELADQWAVRDPDPWYEDPGCTMTRLEQLCGSLELEEVVDEAGVSTVEVTGLTGRHEAFVAGEAGTDCSDLLGLSEGQFIALPCQVTYELAGAPRDG